MRLGLFTTPDDPRPRSGLVVDDTIADLATATDPAVAAAAVSGSVLGVWELGADAVTAAAARTPRVELAQVRLLAPVPRPGTFYAVGLNYRDHAAEMGAPTPDWPLVFCKASTCVTGPYDDVWMPRGSDELDYEGELGFVVGRAAAHASAADAAAVIAGFVVVDDFSVRDRQKRTTQFTLGKSLDTHGPNGPWLVTVDELGVAPVLRVRTWVNGELRQDSTTDQLIFDVPRIVEVLSECVALRPGDLVTTGTPSGVAMGMDPSPWLVPGDVVRVEIEGIGHIENRIVPEPEPAPVRAWGAA